MPWIELARPLARSRHSAAQGSKPTQRPLLSNAICVPSTNAHARLHKIELMTTERSNWHLRARQSRPNTGRWCSVTTEVVPRRTASKLCIQATKYVLGFAQAFYRRQPEKIAASCQLGDKLAKLVLMNRNPTSHTRRMRSESPGWPPSNRESF